MIYGDDASAKNPEPVQNDRQNPDHEMDNLEYMNRGQLEVIAKELRIQAWRYTMKGLVEKIRKKRANS